MKTPLWKSRTFWTAVIQGVAGILAVVLTQYPELGLVVILKSMFDIMLRIETTTAIK